MPPAKRTATTKKPRPKKPEVVNIDKIADLDLVDVEDVPTKTVEIFGEEYVLYCDVNQWLLTEAATDDPVALVGTFESLFPPEDYARLRQALASKRGMGTENLIKLFSSLLEVASDLPT